MNTFLIIGTQVVLAALVCYAIAVISEQRKKTVSAKVLIFISLGVLLDITATCFMIAGSSKGFISIHGIIGYSALLVMLIDCIFFWRIFLNKGKNAAVPGHIHLYSRYAFIWWIVAFITGGLLAAIVH